MVYLANHSKAHLCGLQEIADEEKIPTAYLGKILGDLRKHHLLRSEKGIHGGYELAQPASTISLWDICQVLEPGVDESQCLLGLSDCSAKNPCALHESWIPARDGVIQLLKTKTIAEIADAQEGLSS